MLRPPSSPTLSGEIDAVRSPRPEEDDGSSLDGYEYALESPSGYPRTPRMHTKKPKSSSSALPPPPPPPPQSSSVHRSSAVKRRQSETFRQQEGRNPSGSGAAASVTSSSDGSAQSPREQDEDLDDNQQTPVPSVHPIDTLSKKLRQQAMELTRVYEELETQTQHVAECRAQLQEQKLELDRLRTQRRKPSDGLSTGAKGSGSARTTAMEQQKRAADMMVGTPSTGASVAKKREQLDAKTKEVEREKKRLELASKRLERVLVELREFQNDRMEALLPSVGASDPDADVDSLRTLVDEQSAYVRVLEEAVRLKASELQVSGHDELLVVLAELRHTIYQQEKELEDKNRALAAVQGQLQSKQQETHDAKEEVAALLRQQQEETQHLREKEAERSAQLEAAHRQLQQQQEQANRLRGASTDAQRKEQSLQERLAAAAKTQSASDAKLEDDARRLEELQKRVAVVVAEREDVTCQRDRLRDECAKKQTHLDEMNALQEELLASMDSYASKTERAQARVEQLEEQLGDRRQQADKETAALTQQVETLRGQVESADRRGLEMQSRCAALQQERDEAEKRLAEVRHHLTEQTRERDARRQERQDSEQEHRRVQEAVAELEAAVATALRMMTATRPPHSPTEGQQGQSSEAFEAERCMENATQAEDDGANTTLVDAEALESFRTCCHALSTLLEQDKVPQSNSLLPSVSAILARVAQAGADLLREVDSALASWTRERSDLLEACATLETTTRTCQEEMAARHAQLLECQCALVERTSEVEAHELQTSALHQQVRALQVECASYHELEQHATDLETTLGAKQALLVGLMTESERLQAVERELAAESVTNEQRARRLQDQQRAMKEQQQQIQELERALESAATLAEQQNESNRQLSTQLHEMKSSLRDWTEACGALEARHEALTHRFAVLVGQYTAFLRPMAVDDKTLQETLAAVEDETQHGDVLRLLQLFPTLLEAYAENCRDGPEQAEVARSSLDTLRPVLAKNSATSARLKGKKAQEKPLPHRQAHAVATVAWRGPPHADVNAKQIPQATVLQSVALDGAGQEDFDEQLEHIRDAFRSYR